MKKLGITMITAGLALWAAGLAGISSVAAQTGDSAPAAVAGRIAPWDPDTVRRFEALPLQEGGRVKPLKTYADVLLLKFNGRRSCADFSGKSIDGIRWLMDCLVFPEQAKKYKMFLIPNSDVMVDLGLAYTKRRDRYSYEDLAFARTRLFERARTYSAIERPMRRVSQTQLIDLADNVFEFESLLGALDAARLHLPLKGTGPFESLGGGADTVPVSVLLAKASAFFEALQAWQKLDKNSAEYTTAMHSLLEPLSRAAEEGGALALIPSADSGAEWTSVGALASQLFDGGTVSPAQVALMQNFETLVSAGSDQDAFGNQARNLFSSLTGMASARGEYRAIGLEVLYHKADFVYNSLYLYGLAFLGIAFSWLRPNWRWLHRANLALVTLPTLYLAVGITIRCVIRMRPPVTTLYETILFVVWCAVVVCLFIEWVNRRKLGLAMAATLGMVGLFLANKYEMMEGEDTMPSMVAVLDTNFWLATHVTTVTIGYSAGLLAAALSHVFVFGKALRFGKGDPHYYRQLNGMVYGVLCFALLFSIIGTILGGIWANESWGRFWGWDPKENGALMICLWQLAVLHAVRGRYIKDYGLHLAAIFGGVIVAFSWFGVNQLGVGLHSYGFTSGITRALLICYSVETLVILVGGLVWMLDRYPGVYTGDQEESAPQPSK